MLLFFFTNKYAIIGAQMFDKRQSRCGHVDAFTMSGGTHKTASGGTPAVDSLSDVRMGGGPTTTSKCKLMVILRFEPANIRVCR